MKILSLKLCRLFSERKISCIRTSHRLGFFFFGLLSKVHYGKKFAFVLGVPVDLAFYIAEHIIDNKVTLTITL